MPAPALVADLALAPLAGWLGTRAMTPVSTWMYDHESAADREREDTVRPGWPHRIAAEKTTALLGLDLSDAALDRGAVVYRQVVAASWAPTYALLRRRTRLGPVACALTCGLTMFAVVDEGMTPALGLSAPNRAYPAATHLRGLMAHLAYGCGVAAATETAWRLLGRRPTRR